MDKFAKATWIEALRSGEFEQGQHMLVQETAGGTRYCCLGVLCEVFPWLKSSEDAELLDLEACELLGLTQHAQSDLAKKNDELNDDLDYAWPFERIANWIERNL